jgi:hypothetical protein
MDVPWPKKYQVNDPLPLKALPQVHDAGGLLFVVDVAIRDDDDVLVPGMLDELVLRDPLAALPLVELDAGLVSVVLWPTPPVVVPPPPVVVPPPPLLVVPPPPLPVFPPPVSLFPAVVFPTALVVSPPLPGLAPPSGEKSWKPRMFAQPTTARDDEANVHIAKRDNRAI